MIDLLERIGPYLGIAAFLGLAILAFLIIQQAREVRRLREWAGRAPERADEAAAAAAAAAAARGEEAEAPEQEAVAEPGEPGPWDRLRGRLAGPFGELDRRMPVDPRYLIAVLAAVLIAIGVLTSGFGLLGGDDDGGGGGGGKRGADQERQGRIEVAVLNATQVEEGPVPIEAVSGLAGRVASEVIKPVSGFKVGTEETAGSGFQETTIMFEPEAEAEAEDLARAVAGELGETTVTPMINEVRELSAGAPVALVIGQDDAEF